MKLLFAILLLALIGVQGGDSDDVAETRRKNHRACLEETGADEEKLKALRDGDFSDDDEKTQLYVHCRFRKAGIMNENGDFLKDVAMEKLPEDVDRQKASDAIDACIDTKGSSNHETAFLMLKCYHEHNPDHAIM